MAEARPYKSLPRQVYELIAHKIRINTCFRDYYRYGFYKGNLSWEEKSMYLGPNGSKYWPFEGNSLRYDTMFVVKSIQKALIMGSGLPTPRLLLKVGSDYPINSIESFREQFAAIDVSMVCKFDGGGGGADIFLLDRDENGFNANGTPVDADWVWSKYGDRIERGFFIEEQIPNHPALAELYPHALNSLRIATARTGDGTWHCMNPFLKIGRGGARVDNMSAGGLFAGVDEDGIAGIAYCKYDNSEYSTHPDTSVAIEGFQVPFFREALELAQEASRTFGFMQTFGWDIAITPDGPTIIEANTGWHFKAVQQRLGPYLTPRIAAGLHPRSWFTPWDRTHMHPMYMSHYHGGPWQRFLAARRRYWRRKLSNVDTSE